MLLFQHSALGRAAQTTSPAASQPTDKAANETVRQSEQRRRKEVPGTLLPGNPLKLTRYHRKKNRGAGFDPWTCFFFGSVFSFLEIAKRKTSARREQTNQPRKKHTNKQTKKQTPQQRKKQTIQATKHGETDATKERQTQPSRDTRVKSRARACVIYRSNRMSRLWRPSVVSTTCDPTAI